MRPLCVVPHIVQCPPTLTDVPLRRPLSFCSTDLIVRDYINVEINHRCIFQLASLKQITTLHPYFYLWSPHRGIQLQRHQEKDHLRPQQLRRQACQNLWHGVCHGVLQRCAGVQVPAGLLEKQARQREAQSEQVLKVRGQTGNYIKIIFKPGLAWFQIERLNENTIDLLSKHVHNTSWSMASCGREETLRAPQNNVVLPGLFNDQIKLQDK